MAKAIRRETIHAAGIDIGIYTTNFKNAFVFSIKDWSEKLEAIGLFTKSGRYAECGSVW